MKKLLLSLIAVFSFFIYATAQDGPAIKFEELHYDFKKINENGGHAIHVFKFKNIGNQPLKLDRVQPSCGCTTSDYTKGEIKPGGEGYVKSEFDPVGRPGAFTKSIQVYSNTNPNLTLITFGGEVVPKQKTYEDSFPNVSGNIRYEQNIVNFGQLKNNVKDTVQYLTIMNMGSKNITIKEAKANKYISMKTPVLLQKRVATKIPVHYDATLPKDYGLLFEQMRLITDDEKDPEKNISVIADIHQYVAPMTEKEKAKAPKLELERKQHDFGEIKEGETVSTVFKFTNKGKNDLEIFKVKTTCGCTVAELDKKKYKHGEAGELKVSYNSSGKHGRDQKPITLYTNDPDNTEIELKILSNVQALQKELQNDVKPVIEKH